MKKSFFIFTTLLTTGLILSACTGPATPSSSSSTTTSSATKNTQSTASYTLTEVGQHNSASDCWLVIDNTVYDVTTYMTQHPGGRNTLIPECGQDATAAFDQVRKHQSGETQQALLDTKIGSLKNN